MEYITNIPKYCNKMGNQPLSFLFWEKGKKFNDYPSYIGVQIENLSALFGSAILDMYCCK